MGHTSCSAEITPFFAMPRMSKKSISMKMGSRLLLQMRLLMSRLPRLPLHLQPPSPLQLSLLGSSRSDGVLLLGTTLEPPKRLQVTFEGKGRLGLMVLFPSMLSVLVFPWHLRAHREITTCSITLLNQADPDMLQFMQ